jgi:RNA polymerase sigma-70 factor (ECF subfamily)
MGEGDQLVQRFEANRPRLRGVAYRILGSLSDADDAVQEAWLRLSRAGDGVDNLDAWLTTVVARVCLDVLRSRKVRRETPLEVHLPDLVITPDDGATGPEAEALLADSVGLALLVVLDTLAPAERLAFVLHDMFDLPFDEIAPIVDRSPAAARQLASRARRRVRGAAAPDPDLTRQRQVVDAFFAAARRGDFDALVTLLDPEVVAHADGGVKRRGASVILTGAAAVAGQALTFAQPSALVRPVLVNGAAGVVITVAGRPIAVMGFIVVNGKIAEIDSVVDPDRLDRLDLGAIVAAAGSLGGGGQALAVARDADQHRRPGPERAPALCDPRQLLAGGRRRARAVEMGDIPGQPWLGQRQDVRDPGGAQQDQRRVHGADAGELLQFRECVRGLHGRQPPRL